MSWESIGATLHVIDERIANRIRRRQHISIYPSDDLSAVANCAHMVECDLLADSVVWLCSSDGLARLFGAKRPRFVPGADDLTVRPHPSDKHHSLRR